MAEQISGFDADFNRGVTFSTYDSRGGVNSVKRGAGFVRSVTFAQMDAAPTAGDITIYDMDAVASVYGDANTVVLLRHSQTTAVFMPVTVFLDRPFVNGLGIGFTSAIKDVNVSVSYK